MDSKNPEAVAAGMHLLLTHMHSLSHQMLVAKGLRRDVLLAVLAKAKQKVPHRLYAVCLMDKQIGKGESSIEGKDDLDH